MKARPILRHLPLLCVLTAGCGSTSPANNVTPVDGGVDADAPAADPNSASISLSIDPGVEKTVCITTRLGNKEAMWATKMIGDLTSGSHHMIIYRSNDTEESLVPRSCVPFAGLIGGREVMIAEAARRHEENTLPPGVAFKLGQNQMIKLEAHYINTTKEPLLAKGTFRFEGVPVASAADMKEANGFFWGTTKIEIPAKSTFKTPQNFQVGLAGTKVFVVHAHQHRFGIREQAWFSKTAGDVSSAPILDDSSWAEPRMQAVDPMVDFDGTSGLTYQCEWSNTSDSLVTYGESALQEMCFLFGFYYPSKTFDVCVDGTCVNRK